MKILHVISYFQPQLGYQEFYLAREQQKMGHEVHVVTSDRYYPFGDFWDSRLVGSGFFHEEGIAVYRLPCVFEIGTYCIVAGMKRVVEKLRPDVIHAHEIPTVSPALPALYARRLHSRYVIDTHGFLPYQGISRLFNGVLKRTILGHAVTVADSIVAVTPACQEWFSNEFRVPSRNIHMIPLGVDSDVFRPDPMERNRVRRRLSIDKDDAVILFAGRLDPAKRIETLLSAFSKIKHNGYDKARLLLVGGGSSGYMQKLVREARISGIEDSTIFHGMAHRTEIASLYNVADIAVWPARHPLSILEAMATGLPIILTEKFPANDYPFADTADRFIEYENGLTFDEGDIDGLSKCLEKLLSDTKLRTEMGRRSRKLIEDKLTWRNVTMRFLRIYDSS